MSDLEPTDQSTVIPNYGRVIGEVSLRFGRTSPFGAAELPFSGNGMLVFDPAAPDRLLSLSTLAPASAETTLAAAIGQTASGQLSAWHLGGDRPEQLLVQPGSTLADLARLALTTWLGQWCPLDIPHEAAMLDIGLSAEAAGDTMLAFRSHGQSAGFLVELAERGLAADSLPDAIRDGIEQMLRSATNSLGTGHASNGKVSGLVARYQAATDRAHDVLADRLAELLDADQLTTAAPSSGLDAADTDPDREEVFSIDWALVPARVFRSMDGQGLITRSATGIQIVVDPARWLDRTETFGLRVRLINSTNGVPLASTPLRWDSQTAQFRAEFRYNSWQESVPEAELNSGLPEVYAELPDGTQPRPRIGDARISSDAWRRAVWALTWCRRGRAAALVFGSAPDAARVLDLEHERARRDARAAARLLKTIGPAGVDPRLDILAWRDGLTSARERAMQNPSAWPTGLAVPGAMGVSRPLLSEMIEVAAPELWPG